MKYCKKCDTTLEFSSFGRDKHSKDGMQAYCKSCRTCMRKEYYSRNKDIVLEYQNNYYHSNRSSIQEKTKVYSKSNPAKICSKAAKRRAYKLSATPSWLTDEHKASIDSVYWLAKDLKAISGEEYHVDHIIPLKGNDVCGLHVPWNLQVLSAADNLKKSNRLT